MGRRELVEKLALQPRPREHAVLALDLLAHLGLELGEVVQPHGLGQGVVDRHRRHRAQFLDLDIEARFLAGQAVADVVLGKGDFDLGALARPRSDELILEAGDEHVGPELQMEIGVGAALERLAVDLADEIEHQDIALPRLAATLDRLGSSVLGGDALQRLLDLGVLDIGLEPFELELGEIHGFDLGQNLDRHGEFQVLTLGKGRDFDLWSRRRTEIALAHCPGGAVGDRLLDNLVHHRLAVPLFEQR